MTHRSNPGLAPIVCLTVLTCAAFAVAAPDAPRPGTGAGPPPPYAPLRQMEDYSYLKDPARRTDSKLMAMPAPPTAPFPATLAILAGGEGSRMSTPKGELLLDGRPILHAILDRLDWPGPTLLVTAPGRERPPGAERFSRECVDPVAGQGPLRGLLTALEHAPTCWLVVTAVDMPLVRREQLAWLVAALQNMPGAAGLLTTRPQVEPFPSAFHRDSAAAVVHGALASGRRALHALLDEPSIQSVPAPADWPLETWTNLNRPEDLDALRAAASR